MNRQPDTRPDVVDRRQSHPVPVTTDDPAGRLAPGAFRHDPPVAQPDEIRAMVAHVAALALQGASNQPEPAEAIDPPRSTLAEPGVWIMLLMLALVAVVAIVATVAVLALSLAGG